MTEGEDELAAEAQVFGAYFGAHIGGKLLAESGFRRGADAVLLRPRRLVLGRDVLGGDHEQVSAVEPQRVVSALVADDELGGMGKALLPVLRPLRRAVDELLENVLHVGDG